METSSINLPDLEAHALQTAFDLAAVERRYDNALREKIDAHANLYRLEFDGADPEQIERARKALDAAREELYAVKAAMGQ